MPQESDRPGANQAAHRAGISDQLGSGSDPRNNQKARPNQGPPPASDLWNAALFAAGQVVAAARNGITITAVALRHWNGIWVAHLPNLDISANSAIGREVVRAGIAAQLLAGVESANLELIGDAHGKNQLTPVTGRERIRCAEAANRLRPHAGVILALARALATKREVAGEELTAQLAPISQRHR